MIKLKHISYWYEGHADPALRDVSLEIESGESVCLMGRNGSGKSTLVKLIAGLIKPTRGTLGLGDGTEGDAPSVGILFQNPDNQMVAMQVEKEIAFALENRAVPLAEMKTAVNRTARQFGIEHLLGRLTNELSGGEKQRVALASIMIQRPSILLLDEPDSYLDQAGRELLAHELRRLHERDPGLIELRVTQSTEAARRYRRLIVMDRGRVVADGTPDDLLGDRELGLRTGLLVPDLTKVKFDLPETLASAARDGEARVAEVVVEDLAFSWPMADPLFVDVCGALRSSETVGVVGPTGSGKSTLGLILAGLAEPSGGERIYSDKRGNRLTESRIRGQVVLVLQQPERQFFLDTCAEEIAFGPTNLDRALPAGEIDQYFAMVGLNPARYADRDPFTLSAGEKRRLAFAAVLSLAPSLVVFDEPTAGLDGEGVGRFLALSTRLREAGLGQMIISHDGDVVARLADRILCLRPSGGWVELTPEQLLSDSEYAGLVSKPTAD